MSLRAPPCFRLDRSVLVLKGRCLDRISMSTPVSFDSPSLDRHDESYIQIWSQRLRSWTAVLIHLGINLQNVTALCRVLAPSIGRSPTDWEGYSVTEATAFNFWCVLRQVTNVVRATAPEVGVDVDVTATIEICDSVIRELFTLLFEDIDVESFNPDSTLNSDESRAFEGIRSYVILRGRSFCVTENGKTCNAMNQPRKGDMVAALEGTRNLWILRPVGTRYRLIGEAYVDGLMEGEAYEGLNPDKVDYEIELV